MKIPALFSDAAASWPPDANALAHAVLGVTGNVLDLAPIADLLKAPLAEVTASAVSVRVAAAAASEGHAFVHHELRLPAPLATDLQPELDVGGALDDGIDWQHGRLAVPKYFSAFLEAPLPTFDPNHRGKWRPHELLHRLSRFSWAPDSSRFAAYLSARLSELLPVVHWYGFDEIGRAHCPAHYGVMPGADVCDLCEHAASPVNAEQQRAHDAHAQQFAALALAHLDTELDACQRELQTGVVVSTPRPGLDASSDAIGYMRAHWNRITAWSFGAWIERFAVPGRDYFTNCSDQLDHVRSLVRQLISAPLEYNEGAAVGQRQRRFIQDIGYRALLCVETIDSAAVEDDVLPAIDALAALAAATSPPDPAHTAEILRDLDRGLRNSTDDAANVVFAGGWGWRDPPGHTTEHVCEGLRTGLVRSLELVDEAALQVLVGEFVRHPIFWEPGEVFVRFSRFVAASPEPQPPWAEAVRLEAWLLSSPLVDLEAERFAGVPGDEVDVSEGRTRPNTTLRIGTFDVGAAALVLDWATQPELPTNREVTLVGAQFGGAPRAVELDDAVRDAVAAARDGRPCNDRELFESLVSVGILVWFPPVA